MNAIAISLPAVKSISPGVNAAIERFGQHAFAAVDPVILELARIRIAMLLGAKAPPPSGAAPELSAEKRQAIPLWPKSPLFSDVERACLDYVEQYALDSSAMTDAQIQGLSAHFTQSEIFALAHAVYLLDGYQRTQIVFGAVLNETDNGGRS